MSLLPITLSRTHLPAALCPAGPPEYPTAAPPAPKYDVHSDIARKQPLYASEPEYEEYGSVTPSSSSMTRSAADVAGPGSASGAAGEWCTSQWLVGDRWKVEQPHGVGLGGHQGAVLPERHCYDRQDFCIRLYLPS
jgi:hypothetical protein